MTPSEEAAMLLCEAVPQRRWLLISRSQGRLIPVMFYDYLPRHLRSLGGKMLFACELPARDWDRTPWELLEEYALGLELYGRPPWPSLGGGGATATPTATIVKAGFRDEPFRTGDLPDVTVPRVDPRKGWRLGHLFRRRG